MVKNLPANAEDVRHVGLIPGLGRFCWKRTWQLHVFLPGEFHGQGNLGGIVHRVAKSWTRLN